MEKWFFVVWNHSASNGNPLTSIVKISHPPHDTPRGDVLRCMLLDGAHDEDEPTAVQASRRLYAAIELGIPSWNQGAIHELATYNGAIATLECTKGAWRIVR